MVDVDDSSLQADSQPIGWLGLRVNNRLALLYSSDELGELLKRLVT